MLFVKVQLYQLLFVVVELKYIAPPLLVVAVLFVKVQLYQLLFVVVEL